jgi:hypothetical protein
MAVYMPASDYAGMDVRIGSRFFFFFSAGTNVARTNKYAPSCPAIMPLKPCQNVAKETKALNGESGKTM